MFSVGRGRYFSFLKSAVIMCAKAALIPCITKEENLNKLKL